MKQCNKCNIVKPLSEYFTNEKHKDGYVLSCKLCHSQRCVSYRKTKRGHLTNYLKASKTRAKAKNIDHNIDLNYLESIATDVCPVFKTTFDWGMNGKGRGYERPSLDRIIPELGYVKGNVVFISMVANQIKSAFTEKELYLVADWLHDARKKVLNVKKNTTSPVPEGHHREGEVYPKLGPISTAGSGEDYYDLDHYQRTVPRQDADHRTQTRGGDSVGHGGGKVGAPTPIEGEQDNWQLHPTYGWIER